LKRHENIINEAAGIRISDVIVKVSGRKKILRHFPMGCLSFIFSRSVSFHIGARALLRVSSHS